MLASRTDKILRFIITEYIGRAVPVPSQLIFKDTQLGVSPATIRNEMAYLEEEGYITRPHTSAGAVPTDKGYRHYVDSLNNLRLPQEEQLLVSHLFHQVEQRLEEWLTLTASLVARSTQNMAMVTLPKPADSEFQHLELVYLHGTLVLLVLVLRGGKVMKQLISFEQPVKKDELTSIANRLTTLYAGLTRSKIKKKKLPLEAIEKQISQSTLEMMQAEDERKYDEPYLDGWHFMLKQPELARTELISDLMELVDERRFLELVIPHEHKPGVRVIIGRENRAEAVRECSVVLSEYGLPDRAVGTIVILGPTRMPYARAISTIDYMATLLSEMVANLYGEEEGQRG